MNIDKKINRKIVLILTILMLSFIALITIDINKKNISIKGEGEKEIKLTDRIAVILSKKLNIGIEDISILYVDDIENDKLTMFLYEDKNKSYEGLCRLAEVDNTYEILKTSIGEIDKDVPFTVNTMEIKEDINNSSYKIFSGVINKPNIKSININFNNNTMTNVLVGEDNSYFYMSKQANLDVLSIEALDDSLKVFYQWLIEEMET
ncbi:MAG: hypothetical protein ACLSV2_12005 [Clostridium sp.]